MACKTGKITALVHGVYHLVDGETEAHTEAGQRGAGETDGGGPPIRHTEDSGIVTNEAAELRARAERHLPQEPGRVSGPLASLLAFFSSPPLPPGAVIDAVIGARRHRAN